MINGRISGWKYGNGKGRNNKERVNCPILKIAYILQIWMLSEEENKKKRALPGCSAHESLQPSAINHPIVLRQRPKTWMWKCRYNIKK